MASKNPQIARKDIRKKQPCEVTFAAGKPSAIFMKALDAVAKMPVGKG